MKAAELTLWVSRTLSSVLTTDTETASGAKKKSEKTASGLVHIHLDFMKGRKKKEKSSIFRTNKSDKKDEERQNKLAWSRRVAQLICIHASQNSFR